MLHRAEPQRVFWWFMQLSRIPRSSDNPGPVSDWCFAAASALGCSCKRDAVGNVYIFKQASSGYEGAEPILLQGHMDMVCVMDEGCVWNPSTDGVSLCTDGDWIWADGTSLGADNGIAVAMLLALLENQTAQHPPLEILLTVDEEGGMTGAQHIEPAWIRSRRMINLDAEQEGTFWAGCAGGSRAEIHIPISYESQKGWRIRLQVYGLLGGHSGVEINKGRANAILLLGRVLQNLQKSCAFRVLRVESAGPGNAIPSKATAELVCAGDPQAILREVKRLELMFQKEYRLTDPQITLQAEVGEYSACLVTDYKSMQRLITLLTCSPNGVQEMSAETEGLPRTSLNFGSLSMTEHSLDGVFFLRSNVSSQLVMLQDRLMNLAAMMGGEAVISAGHPAWEYAPNSLLRAQMVRVYEKNRGVSPSIRVTHAGAECGVLMGRLPGIDCVAIGPEIQNAHTVRERVRIQSVERTWQYLLELLQEMKMDIAEV